jgi:arylsulfatase A-like enzyme
VRHRTALPLLVLLAAGLLGAQDAPGPRPNVILVLVDDMGWTDLGCFGSGFYQTPHIDRLASRGMRFTHAYAACTVCSPTRASLMTGKYPPRVNITDWIPGHKRPKAKLRVPEIDLQLALEETTIAEVLKEAGYATASVGKWHLGGPAFFPDRQGFDLNAGGYDKGQPPSYFSPYRIPTLQDGEKDEYLTDRLSREAVRFIEANKDRPFFLYFPHYAVHTPLMGKKEVVEKYRARARPGAGQSNAVYASMVESVDDGMGLILSKLDELKIEDRTVVIFTSDNGGLLRSTSNEPLRAGKGSAYEGGVRVPLIVRWPGVAAPGSVCEAPVISPDLFATIAEIAGAKGVPAGTDGESLVPLLRRTGGLRREAVYWHYPHYHPGGATPYGAVRKGDYKLVEFFEDGRLELYNLKEDVGEQKDLAADQPDRAKEFRELLSRWRASVGARMPTPNPDYDPKVK